MLVKPKFNKYTTPVSILSGEAIIDRGVYLSGFNPRDYFDGNVEQYFETPDKVYSYGVCDGWENLKKQIPLTIASNYHYVVFLSPVYKRDQPLDGGWRWHKWGEYIGDFHPTREYLADEPDIETVYCYTIIKISPELVSCE